MTTWVLLRGLTRESRHWGDFPALLGERLGSPTIVTLDLPGNGRLNAQRSPSNVQAMAGYCRGALLQRGLMPPYHVLAMSLGAMVALAWASAHPHELNGCVLINTSVRTFSAWHQRLRPRNLGPLLGLALQRDPVAQERAILAMTTRHPGVAPEPLLAQWAAWRRENPVSRANALRQLWAAARCRPPRAAPDVAILLLASAADGLVSPRCSSRLAQAWGCELRLHPSAGHDLPLDDGAWVAQQVADWVQGEPTRRSPAGWCH
jgi:pimeloyl-ACP methyl ester carboxylesterase